MFQAPTEKKTIQSYQPRNPLANKQKMKNFQHHPRRLHSQFSADTESQIFTSQVPAPITPRTSYLVCGPERMDNVFEHQGPFQRSNMHILQHGHLPEKVEPRVHAHHSWKPRYAEFHKLFVEGCVSYPFFTFLKIN